jgi:hypothetical protein
LSHAPRLFLYIVNLARFALLLFAFAFLTACQSTRTDSEPKAKVVSESAPKPQLEPEENVTSEPLPEVSQPESTPVEKMAIPEPQKENLPTIQESQPEADPPPKQEPPLPPEPVPLSEPPAEPEPETVPLPEPKSDTKPLPEPEVGPLAEADTETAPKTEPVAERALDLALEPEPEPVPKAEGYGETEAGAGVEIDAYDTDSDADPDTDAGADTDTDAGAGADTEAADAEAEGEIEPETRAEPELEPATGPEAKVEPEPNPVRPAHLIPGPVPFNLDYLSAPDRDVIHAAEVLQAFLNERDNPSSYGSELLMVYTGAWKKIRNQPGVQSADLGDPYVILPPSGKAVEVEGAMALGPKDVGTILSALRSVIGEKARIRALQTLEMAEWWSFNGIPIEEPALVLETENGANQYLFFFQQGKIAAADELDALPDLL